VLIELDPVDRITTGAVGSPGSRVFYLQGRRGDQLVTLLLEKQQVQLLAASVLEILHRVGKETGKGPPEEAMDLEEPIVPEWRAGRLSIGYHEGRDLMLLEAEEVVEEEADEAVEEEEAEDDSVIALEPEVQPLETRTPETGPVQGNGEPKDQEIGDGENRDDLEGIDALEAAAEIAASIGEPQRVRFWATREQMLSLAQHGAAVCAQGRPRCQLCGNPLEPGHHCPALNGHRDESDS
jgi:uncharacterized repeat protein (TIGR03847 family)